MIASTANSQSSRRLHPVSLLFEFASILRANVIPTIAAIVGTSRGGWVGIVVGAVVFGISAAVAIIRYVTFRYRISNGELIVDSGLINRVHRTVPLSRIQNIDLSQNLFHRILGVGEVRVETASGKEPEAVMRVIAIKEYSQLRNELLSFRNSGLDELREENVEQMPVSGSQTKAPELILALPTRLVLLAGFLSNRGEVIAGLAIGFLWQQRFSDKWFASEGWDKESVRESIREGAQGSASSQAIRWVRGLVEYLGTHTSSPSAILLVLIGLLIVFAVLRTFSATWYLLKFYGYRLERIGDSVHVRCGLLTKVSATIPLGRIQLISIQQKWLIRKFGLSSIRIETAGGEKESDDAASSIGRKWFVPIVDHSDVPRLLAILDPRLDRLDERIEWQPQAAGTKSRMFRSILVITTGVSLTLCYWSIVTGLLFGAAFVVLGWMYVGKKAKSLRYARTEWGLVYRSGTWERKTSITFFDKLQSVALNQSPFDQGWKMATLKVDTAASGPADHRIEIKYLDVERANSELRAIIQSVLPRMAGTQEKLVAEAA